MYAIYAYIDPQNHPNVGIYGIHGVSGIYIYNIYIYTYIDPSGTTPGLIGSPMAVPWVVSGIDTSFLTSRTCLASSSGIARSVYGACQRLVTSWS